MGGSGLPSNTWFPGPTTRVLNPNGISIGSAVFAGLTSVTDRRTDRQIIYVLSTAIRPNNATAIVPEFTYRYSSVTTSEIVCSSLPHSGGKGIKMEIHFKDA